MSSVSRRALRALLAAVGLVAVAALLAACGETKDESSASSGSSGGASTPAASEGANPDAPIKSGLKTVSIPKQLGNPYEEFEHSGIDEALKELGGSNRISGPTDAANEAIPVPAGITFFREEKRRGDMGPSVFFMSRLSVNDLLAFYRAAYAKKAFTEDTPLTQVDAKGASIVLEGTSPLKLIVQITAIPELPGTNAVSVRFEPKR